MSVERRPLTDPGALLGEDYEAFESVLSGSTVGPLAVVSDPFAGREAVLDHAEEGLGATRVRLAPGDDLSTVRDALGDGPLVVDDCQHLYSRQIGGFADVEAFLGLLARTDALVVTGWNRYAWTYLSLVRGIDQAFEVNVDVGPMETARLAELLLSRHEDVPEFVLDDVERHDLIAVRRVEFGWRGRTVSVPIPRPNLVAFTELWADTSPNPKDIVFERLTAVSAGNVGVATAIWDLSVGGEIRPSDIVAPGTERTLDHEEAFCLRVVIAKERIERAELEAIIGDVLDRLLGRLTRAGLVAVEEDLVVLEPAAVTTAAAGAERRRIL